MSLKVLRLAGAITLVVLTVAACGGDASTTTSSPPSSTAPEAEASEPAPSTTSAESESGAGATESAAPQGDAPNLGDRALKLGQPRQGSAVTTTLHEVKIPYTAGNPPAPQPGNVHLGLRVQQCVEADAPAAAQQFPHTFNGEWFAVTSSGDQVNAGQGSYDGWPLPKFPENQAIVPGRCVKGWISIEVPEGTKPTTILYTPDATPIAEWKLP